MQENSTQGGAQQTITVDSLLAQIVSSLPTVIAPIVQSALSAGITKVLGASSGQSILSTTDSAYGLSQRYTQGIVNKVAEELGGSAKDEHLQQRIESALKVLISDTDWFARSPENRAAGEAGYQRYIESEAQGLASKLSAISKILGINIDPEGSAVSSGMERYVQSLIQSERRSGKGLRESIRNGKRVAEELFTGEYDEGTGSFAEGEGYKPSDWGGFKQSDIANLASELAGAGKLPTLSDDSAEALRSAIESSRRVIKEYAEALEPLRDVFGGDMNAIIQQLQSISGTSIGRQNTKQLQSLVTTVSHVLSTGVGSAEELAGSVAIANRDLSNMSGLGVYNYISGAEQGVHAMYAWKGQWFQPDYLTDSQAQAHAHQLVSKTFNSDAADMFAQAYSLWANTQAGDDKSFETFQKLVDDAVESGEDRRKAAMRIAGAENTAELRQGQLYGEYREAITSGDAGSMATRGYTEKLIRRGRRRIAHAFSGEKGLGDQEVIRENYDALIKLIQDNPNLINMSDEERAKYLQENAEKLGLEWTNQDGTKTSNIDEAAAKEINKYFNGMKSDKVLNKTITAVGANSNMQKGVEDQHRQEKSRKDLEDLNKKIQDTGSGWFGLIRDGDFSLDKLRERLGLEEEAFVTGERADALKVAGSVLETAKDITLHGRDYSQLSDEEKNAVDTESAQLAESLYKYAMSPEGYANTDLTAALKELQGMSEDDRKDPNNKRAQQLKQLIYAYSTLSPDVIKKLQTMPVYDAQGKELTGDEAKKKREELISGIVLDEPKDHLADAAKWKLLEAELQGMSKDDQKAAEDILKKYKKTADKGADDYLQVGEGWQKFYEGERDRLTAQPDSKEKTDRLRQLESLNSAMSGAGSGEGNLIRVDTTKIIDILREILNTIQKQDRLRTKTEQTKPLEIPESR